MTDPTRRLLLVACAGAIAALRVRADATDRRLAVLSTTLESESKPYGDAFYDGLKEFGWIKGRNLIVDVRYSDGDRSRFPALAAELLALKPDVLLASTDHAAASLFQ